MVARVLFPVLPCGGTRSHHHHRATNGQAWLRRIVGATLAVALDANGRPPWVLAVALDANGRPPWVLVVAGSLAVALGANGRPPWAPVVARRGSLTYEKTA